jgi:hypothetical protein
MVGALIATEDGDGDGDRDEADGGWEECDRGTQDVFDGQEGHARCAGAAFVGGGAGRAREGGAVRGAARESRDV